MNDPTERPLLTMKAITKRFPGVLALDRIDLDLYEGEILGLIGENGAGKSTLMRILGGDYPSDEGDVCFGKRAEITDVQHSIALGVFDHILGAEPRPESRHRLEHLPRVRAS